MLEASHLCNSKPERVVPKMTLCKPIASILTSSCFIPSICPSEPKPLPLRPWLCHSPKDLMLRVSLLFVLLDALPAVCQNRELCILTPQRGTPWSKPLTLVPSLLQTDKWGSPGT